MDHAKDQVMTTRKLALANLVLGTRDRYFPMSFAQATWHRLEPFFRLPVRIERGNDTVQVELRPYTDRRLARYLAGLCQRVETTQPRVPDGRAVVVVRMGMARSTWLERAPQCCQAVPAF